MKSIIFGTKLIECRIHWVRYWIAWLFTAVFSIGALSYILEGNFEDGLILLGGGILFALIPTYCLTANCIVLTDKMIYAKKGLLKTRELSAPIDKIQNIEIKKGILGRCFGYANVKIDTISGVYSLSGVKNADALCKKFFEIR